MRNADTNCIPLWERRRSARYLFRRHCGYRPDRYL